MHIQGTRFSCCFESFGPMRKEKYNTYRRDWIDGLDCGALANFGLLGHDGTREGEDRGISGYKKQFYHQQQRLISV